MIENRLTTRLDAQLQALDPTWRDVLASADPARALVALQAYIDKRLAQGAVIYPSRPFRALERLSAHDVRVVILGQDPYHGPGQAQGLAFSVPDDCKRPPSLRNIFKELAAEFPEAPMREANDLSDWAAQGVLLLNTCLTVEDGAPASHARQGWETVSDSIISEIARDASPKVFMLWGAHAQAKRALLPPDCAHLVLTANHPSPLSAARPPVPFLGCGHFKQANEWLADQGLSRIDWVARENTLPKQAKLGI